MAENALETAHPREGQLPAFADGMDAQTLYFFLLLCRTQSLPRAAEQLGVSLSSANRMLAKLRGYWGGPLFVRSGFIMQPTLEAKRKYPLVQQVMHLLETLQHDGVFTPESLRRTVRLACYDNAFASAVASCFAEFSNRLPNVTLQVSQADEHMFEQLMADQLDLICFARQGVPAGIHSTPILTTPYSCVVRKGHPLEAAAERKGALTRHDLAPYKQVLVNAQPDRYRRPNGPGNGYFNPDDPEKIALITPFFLSVPISLAGTDFYAIVPTMTCRIAFRDHPVVALPVTASAPKLTMHFGWHERTHHDPGSQYIRSLLIDLIQKRADSVLAEAAPQQE